MEKTTIPLTTTGSLQRPRQRTISPASLIGYFLLIAGAIYTFCPPWVLTSASAAWHNTPRISQQDALTELLLNIPDASKAREWSQYYTSESHLPGQGRSQAEWTHAKWHEFGLPDTKIVSYDTDGFYYPNGQRLALLDLDGSQREQVLYEAALVEDPALVNKPKGEVPFCPAFFGASVDGNVTAPYVFANFGAEEDYQALIEANVGFEGKIGIIKAAQISSYLALHNLGEFRGAQMQRASKMGLVGLLVYQDPEEDADIVPDNGKQPFPYGPARPETMIERGNAPMASKDSPGIPALPIPYADAVPLLRALNGHGPKATELPPRWHGGRLGYKGVEYNIGPTPENVVLNLYNSVNRTTGTVHNVIGTIPGRELEDEVVLIGTHRDAWGPGAGDPGSGSSALNEVVRSFGEALKHGWQPLRTIVFASFEGGEYGQRGSRPWIRENLHWLNRTAVGYLNVVVAASGSQLHVKASPLLHRAAIHATNKVLSPNQTVEGQTVADVWDGDITPAGGGDAIPFITEACISTVDFGFSPGINEPVFPYHSQFDTVEWMDAFGDPDWKHHITSANLWSMMAVHLLESPVLAVSVTDYATSLKEYLAVVQQKVPASISEDLDFSLLEESIARLHTAAVRFDSYAASLTDQLHQPQGPQPWWKKLWIRTTPRSRMRAVNELYIGFERRFYYEDESKHVVFGPEAWHSSEPAFPALVESISAKNITDTYKWERIIGDRIDDATNLLESHEMW